MTFYFRDTLFNDFPDVSDSDFNWSYLPGLYDPRVFLNIPDGYFPDSSQLPVDNNVGGADGDWGGYLPGLDLRAFEDYAFPVSLETKFNNNGPSEAYMIGGFATELTESPEPVIPEPLTMVGAFLGIGSMATYIRKRRLA